MPVISGRILNVVRSGSLDMYEKFSFEVKIFYHVLCFLCIALPSI